MNLQFMPDKTHTHLARDQRLAEDLAQIRKEDSRGLQEYINGIHAETALQRPLRCSCCDGRINSLKTNGEAAIRLPGTVVLVPESEWEAQAGRLDKLGITVLDSHEDCGAAALAYQKEHGKKGTQMQVDQYAEEKVKKFCAKYPRFKFGKHIRKSEMDTAHHSETVLYYDASGAEVQKKFEQSALSGTLTQGFALTESASDNPKAHLLALINIAFTHGVGSSAFDAGTRFRVRVVAPEQSILNAKIATLKNWVKESEHAGKVQVEGFIIPNWA